METGPVHQDQTGVVEHLLARCVSQNGLNRAAWQQEPVTAGMIKPGGHLCQESLRVAGFCRR
jgi:hypothetical protein